MRTLDFELLDWRLRRRAEAHLAENDYCGAVMLVYQDGAPVYTLSLGKDGVNGRPVTPRTFFRLASMSKPVCGAAMLIGEERGWFRMEDFVADYLPEFARMRIGRLTESGVEAACENRTPLRLWHLLSHVSGLMVSDDVGLRQDEAMPMSAKQSLETAVHWYPGSCLSFAPMTAACYSGYAAFDTAARILELKSGMTYADFVRVNLFEPLGITDLTFCPNAEQWSRMARPAEKVDGVLVDNDLPGHTFEDFPLTYTSAGASLSGTGEAYLRFGQCLLHEGEHILKPAGIRRMARPWVSREMPGMWGPDSWGLGVRVCVENPVLPEGSFGWSGAYGTHFFVDPADNLTAVFLKSNRWYDSHGCGSTGGEFEQDVMDSLR